MGAEARYFNRELSWITLYRRLLYEAATPQRPLLDRLLRLAQVSVQLDEYFMVRGADLKREIVHCPRRCSPDGLTPQREWQRLRAAILPLMERQNAHFQRVLQPQLAAEGILLTDYRCLDEAAQLRIHYRFEEEIAPLLHALVVRPSSPWPEFSNLSLILAVGMGKPAMGTVSHGPQRDDLAWVKVPRSLPRFLPIAPFERHRPWVAVPLEQAIAAHLSLLFPQQAIAWIAPVRVTRSANLDLEDWDLDDPDTDNLMALVQENLQQRQQQSDPVRLEVGHSLPEAVLHTLAEGLGLTTGDCYRLPGWLAYGDLVQVADLPRPDLKAPAMAGQTPVALAPRPGPRTLVPFNQPPPPLFQVLRQRDVLVHLPYHAFSATVERFVAEAAADPQVLALKLTLYRTSGDAPVVRSLLTAAKEGKQVVVLVELTASLDEEANLHWARRLEKVGAHVVYGVVGLKTHTNLVLAVRQEGSTLRQYAYIGTGDYLPHRLQPYGDLGLLTSQRILGQDLSHLFNFLTGYSRPQSYQQLWVAPVTLRSRLTTLIHDATAAAATGQPTRLVAKLNVLADPAIIDALYQAAQGGVTIDLIVRGVCCLRPGVPGLSDRIRVVSILGRYVEHSRLVYCQMGETAIAYLGSVDWTPRGLDQRIEVLAPITDAGILAELEGLLDLWLADNQNSWLLQPDGTYRRLRPRGGERPFDVHDHWHQFA
jgi:polyphosphate kinase